ncbi:Ankyrin-3 [Hyphodiscus hymeniophilus]|uniref:Ankyrin-3 n=1 Tax=Hyphodiscus hymeniophilus TaxID=353542 RepID=A0A9P6VRP0_9HELO|nr:Ankyrin-3 [Hyphodiscus hymeniophilus]
MATIDETPAPIEMPKLPAPVKDFISLLLKNTDTPIASLLQPYKAYESELRKVYAQQPAHAAVKDGKVNLVPLFSGDPQTELKVRARSLGTESGDEKSRYLMTLRDNERKSNGAPAIVPSFKDFQRNFNLFSESSLMDLDWNNVIAAGSSVTTALLPVPKKWAGSKRSLREYYHERLAPASDVDLFLYGLNEERALEKIKQIERSIKDSILQEVTTIRSKNAITIVSQYPTRHVQIVLRLYDSISQIITGFDVDCACAAYDGQQVYAAPRAVAAFVTQCNTIDLSRRSPSYENRLSKYSHRGFEVHWPLLERDRIDPTIFERSFGRTQGLARLLILEKLPRSADRDSYMDQRRKERGRPAIPRNIRHQYRMTGNVKDQEEDEVAEWVEQEDVSSYHTMTVPYGPKYHAAKINRLLYAKDLLLNAEWNQQDDREVYLHRHPCFFGTAEEVIQDCCGYCPLPKTDEEIKSYDDELKTYVSGELKFITDDPGRQEIGSFNPITDDEWTTMAYVGDTARLCQAIVDGDLEHVEDWCSQEGVDVNRRDYTGRTPLHLAVMASTFEIVECLIRHGARLIARLVDGRTALHIAAARGSKNMVRTLLDRSLANKEEEEEREDARRAARKAQQHTSRDVNYVELNKTEDDSVPDSDASEIDLESEEGSDSMTMGSFVKVDEKEKQDTEDGVLEDSKDDPDVYDIDTIAWDYGLSPLHLAILNGHLDVVDLLVSEYGADVLLPVKLMQPGSADARAAILTLVLAVSLPIESAREMVKLLLKLGASSAQGDMNQVSALHYIVAGNNSDVLDTLLENDRPAATSVLSRLVCTRTNRYWGMGINGDSPLKTAISKDYQGMVSKLLSCGAKPTITFDEWIKIYLAMNEYAKNHTPEQNMTAYKNSVIQPIIAAAVKGMGLSVEDLLAHGVDANTLEMQAHGIIENPPTAEYRIGHSLLDVIQKKLKTLREYKGEPKNASQEVPETLRDEKFYTRDFLEGSYQHWTASHDYLSVQRTNTEAHENYKKSLEEHTINGEKEKKQTIMKLIQELESTEEALLAAGAKTFAQLHPGLPERQDRTFHKRDVPHDPWRYATRLIFQVPDLNDTKRVGYHILFEAAWCNDFDTIKSLTLAPWEPPSTDIKAQVPPLKIAVRDGNGFSPFSIAVLRGHQDLARKIIDICITQYHKEDGLTSRQRWNILPSDSDDEESDDGENLPIFSELVSDKFTIDNLGEVSNIVRSDVLPLNLIDWGCMAKRFTNSTRADDCQITLMEHAVETDDMNLLKFMIELGSEQQALVAEEEDDQKSYTMSRDLFRKAMELGRTEMLAYMIKTTGVGIPWNDLTKKSGIELKTKPKYYQGLTVGGKKRTDWAQGPDNQVQVVEERIPPVLHAAKTGSVESVEWFMSNAPMRRYKEFAGVNQHDKRIRTLEESGNGFDRTIRTWLGAKSELTLHCAILYNPSDKASMPKHVALIKHLVSVIPEALEQKSSEGWTPLHVALYAERDDIVSYLISAGANQRARDKINRNAIHALLGSHRKVAKTGRKKLQTMIDLFDKDAVKEMLLERCNSHPGALTPLAYFMSCSTGNWKETNIVEILAKYSTGDELEMINGEGDLPLHVAVKEARSSITAFLLSLNPSLLHRENATGRTPLEMARDLYLTSTVQDPPDVFSKINYNPDREDYDSILFQHPSSFLPASLAPEESNKRTYEICLEVDQELINDGYDGEFKRKRRLVSLFEANEVAKRLAGNNRHGRQWVANGYIVDGGRPDVVSEWMS